MPRMLRPVLLSCLVLAASFAAAQAPDWSKVEVKAEKVAGSVYLLTGAGGNIAASVGDDGIVLVDDQYAPLAPKIEAALKGISDKPLRFILNTHWHGDHTGGNAHFGKQGAIVAHTNVRKRLASGLKGGRFGDVPAAEKGALPIVTFDESLTIHLNGENVRALHFPTGHTDGDSIIFFTESNVVHMGDQYFNNYFPYVDLDSGGDVAGYMRNVEKLLATIPDDAKIIPGHGPLATKADLRVFLAMMKETSAAMQAAIKRGETKDAIKAKPEAILGKYAKSTWGGFFIKDDVWVDILYNSYTQAPKGKNPKNDHGHGAAKK